MPIQRQRARALDKYDLDLELRRTLEDGSRVFGVRDCKIPIPEGFFAALSARDPVTADPATRAEGDEEDGGEGGEAPTSDEMVVIDVVASSTGEDHHGTEMTKECLEDMAAQMSGGVVYVPGHWEAEWDDVMGQTSEAEVVPGKIVKSGDDGKPADGFILKTALQLFPDHEKTIALVRALRWGQVIGTSIGGWFTDIEYIYDEDDRLQRIIIHKVSLDHLATTRRPSNRESWIDGLRTRAEAVLRARSEAPASPEAGTDPVADLATEPVAGERAEPAATTTDTAPTVSAPETAELDARAEAGDTTPEPDATQRAVPDDDTDPTGAEMPDESTEVRLSRIDSTLETLTASLTAITGTLTTLAAQRAAPAPAADPVAPAAETPLERAERSNVELRARLQRQITAAGRVGLASSVRADQMISNAGGYKGLVARHAPTLGDDSAVRMACDAQTDRRDAANTYAGNSQVTRETLETDLRTLLHSAHADGLIQAPEGWGV